ncbi:hypothetical protein [Acinetobacter ursingii]|uniref:hypothetical protein n=1 Tax=Acinetobacter ursingii TaxID=108980 RepID=UPI00126A08A3|nr:hypothetical protein [Acinetobacter ursingii]
MDNNLSRVAYKNWFNASFTNEEIIFLGSIGVECKADHNFFKFEILDIASNIKNYRLKKYPKLYERFVDRYIQLTPEFLHSQIDRELLKEDSYYAAWFFNRHCFLEVQKKAKETALTDKKYKFDRVYVLWSPCNDMMCAEKTGGFNLVNYRHSSGVYHEQETEDLHRRI